KLNYKNYMDDYYKNATLIFKIIYDNQVFDRYYESMCEFRNLESKMYSDKHISKLLNSKNKKELGINLMRSRALGCLAIVDGIDKLYCDPRGMTNWQIAAYNSILNLKKELIKMALDSLNNSNEQAKLINYQTYHFKGEENYFKQV
ncbi:MAG: hypothetical protein IJX26_04325, partial [Clostridia bacterium]|nr:hypothetical protein [Clostridia bacterium]